MNRRCVLGSMGLLLVAPALAQSKKTARLGMLLLGRLGPLNDAFFAELGRRGWSQGRNLQVEMHVTASEQERAQEMASELVRDGADVLVTVGTANAVAARKATNSIPIVMLASGFPVESGLAASLARPGGNVTGLSVYAGTALFSKYISLFHELVPNLRNLGVFWGYAPPAFPQVETDLAVGAMRSAAQSLGMNFRVWMNRDGNDLAANLAAADTARLDALFVSAGGPQSVPEGIEKISAFCEKRRLPTMCDIAGLFFLSGGVMAYAVDVNELGFRGASFVDRILRGAKPGELPIEQPTRFELVLNQRRARALGMTIPPTMLIRADRVIE
jgi:putative ABC transport system substrate-binding protein